MNKHHLLKSAAIFAVSVLVKHAAATTVQLSPTDDAMIFDNGSGSDSGNASGHGPGMFAGADANSPPRKKRALVKFDVSGITPMTTLTSVELDLVIGQVAGSGGMGCGMSCGPSSRTFKFYQIDYTTSWSEGDTGLTACNGFTTRCAAMSGTGQGWALCRAVSRLHPQRELR